MTEIILSLDDMTIEDSLSIAYEVRDFISGVKIKSLVLGFGVDVIEEFSNNGLVMVDLKFSDIPSQMEKMINLCSEADIITVYGRRNIHPNLNIDYSKLALVNSLTSEYQTDVVGTLKSLNTVIDHKMGYLVCSVDDLAFIYQENKRDIKIISPGIRLESNNINDQYKISTPERAVKLGADYIVVGRPITKALNPRETAEIFYERLNK